MKFPKQKMRFSSAYGGDRRPEGWLLLDVRGVDLEGVTQIAIDLAEMREVQAKGDQAAEALKQARGLLGGGEAE